MLDSSFETIIAAIEEGRGIFDNIRKIILYLMSNAFIEILLILTSLIAKLPMPLTAIQILWINLASDSFPHLALTVDPKVTGIMQHRPRSPKEPLISSWMLKLMGTVSVVGCVVALSSFLYVLLKTNDALLARSVVFMVVGVSSFAYVFSIRMLRDPFWKDTPFANKWLIVAVLVGLVVQAFPFSTESVRGFFGVVPLGTYWVIPVLSAFLIFFTIELTKDAHR